MKKLFAFVIAVSLLFMLTGCVHSAATIESEPIEASYAEDTVFYSAPDLEFSFVSLTTDDDYLGSGDKFVELVMSVHNMTGELTAVSAYNVRLNDKYDLVCDNAFPENGETETFRVFFRGLETAEVEKITFDLKVFGKVTTTSSGGHAWKSGNELFDRKVIVTTP